MNKLTLINARLSTGSYEEMIDQVFTLQETQASSYVCCTNVHMVIEAYQDPAFRQVLNQADMATPDRPTVAARVTLGEMLYYDKRLSKNQDISCNSCHPLNRYGVDGLPTSPRTTVREVRREHDRPVAAYQVSGEFVGFAEAFFEKYYNASNLTIAIAGDVQPEEVRQLAEQYFSRLPAGEKPPRVWTEEPEQLGERRVVIEEQTQPFVIMGWHRPSINSPDDVVYDVLADVLGRGRTSRLHEQLVESQQALNAAAIASFPGNKYASLFMVYGIPNRGVSPDSIEAALLEQVEQIAEEGITEQELERAKTRARADLIQGLDSNTGLASVLTTFEVLTGDWRNFFRQMDALEALTVDDVQRALRGLRAQADAAAVQQERVVARAGDDAEREVAAAGLVAHEEVGLVGADVPGVGRPCLGGLVEAQRRRVGGLRVQLQEGLGGADADAAVVVDVERGGRCAGLDAQHLAPRGGVLHREVVGAAVLRIVDDDAPVVAGEGGAAAGILEVQAQVVLLEPRRVEPEVLAVHAVETHAEAAVDDHVVRRCYELWFAARGDDPDVWSRGSADQLRVLYGVRGLGENFEASEAGVPAGRARAPPATLKPPSWSTPRSVSSSSPGATSTSW